MQELVDQLLTFEATCLLPVEGAVTDAEAVWQRYRQWAGGRAVSREAFLDAYPEWSAHAERAQLGGRVHLVGIQLRAVSGLTVVGAP